jgi:hypothetical protein
MNEPQATPQATEAPVAVPPDKDARRVVEAILAETRLTEWEQRERGAAHFLRIRLGIIQGDADRLKVLLERRDAEREALVTALIARPGGYQEWDEAKLREDVKNGSDRYLAQWELDVRAALDRVKGGS